MKTIDGARFFTYGETASELDVSKATIQRRVNDGELKTTMVGKFPMVPESEILAAKKKIKDGIS